MVHCFGVARGIFLAYALPNRGNVWRKSRQWRSNQYPVVYEVFEDLAKRTDFKEVPDLFLINGNDTINAYATCVPGYRNFAAVYSDLIDGCLKNNDLKTLRMVLGHELGHIRYNHVKW